MAARRCRVASHQPRSESMGPEPKTTPPGRDPPANLKDAGIAPPGTAKGRESREGEREAVHRRASERASKSKRERECKREGESHAPPGTARADDPGPGRRAGCGAAGPAPIASRRTPAGRSLRVPAPRPGGAVGRGPNDGPGGTALRARGAAGAGPVRDPGTGSMARRDGVYPPRGPTRRRLEQTRRVGERGRGGGYYRDREAVTSHDRPRPVPAGRIPSPFHPPRFPAIFRVQGIPGCFPSQRGPGARALPVAGCRGRRGRGRGGAWRLGRRGGGGKGRGRSEICPERERARERARARGREGEEERDKVERERRRLRARACHITPHQ